MITVSLSVSSNYVFSLNYNKGILKVREAEEEIAHNLVEKHGC